MEKRGFTGSRVVTAVCVALERNNACGRVQRAGRIAFQRIKTESGVVAASGIESERVHAAGRVRGAGGVTSECFQTGRGVEDARCVAK